MFLSLTLWINHQLSDLEFTACCFLHGAVDACLWTFVCLKHWTTKECSDVAFDASLMGNIDVDVKLLPLPQPPLRARTDARTNPNAQIATQRRSVLARVYTVSRQNQTTTTVP
jgi:hypothetical protein